MSAKILAAARKQQSELQDEFGMGLDDQDLDQDVPEQDKNNNNQKSGKKLTFNLEDQDEQASRQTKPFKKFQSNFLHQQKIRKSKDNSDSDSSNNDSDLDDEADEQSQSSLKIDQEEVKINEQDQKAFELFMSNKSQTRRTIADLIMEKLTEKKTEIQTQMSEMNGNDAQTNIDVKLDDRVVKVYTQIKEILQKYRSGKLPKAFKILPTLSNWEHILYITEPDVWSAAAVYQATRLFASNLNAKMAQRFYSLVLLPRIRDDISEYKRLNFHLYMALKKSLFKPAAFFKGILLPMCESKTAHYVKPS